MTDEPTVQFTFAVNDPNLEDEERQEIARKLLQDLRKLDEVEKVNLTKDLAQEEGARVVPLLSTLVGVLTAEVNLKNIQKVLGFIGDRLGDKPMIIKVKVGDQEVEIEAKSRQELAEAQSVVNDLLVRMQGSTDA